MIENHLVELYSHLPNAELLRIQKLLKIILRNNLDRVRLGRVIKDSYERLGRPFDNLEQSGLSETFFKVLSSFGSVSGECLDPAEHSALKKSPYTIWPDEQRCVISGEALDLLAADQRFRKMNFLYGELARMPVRERRAWARWLGLECRVRSEKERCHRLYAYIAEVRSQSQSSATDVDFPEYLDEVFPDNPMLSPVAWFYRGVLPLYQCLQDAERRLTSRKHKLTAAVVIELFRTGQIVARSEAPEFGERSRYRLVTTRETLTGSAGAIGGESPARRYAEAESSHRQEVLF